MNLEKLTDLLKKVDPGNIRRLYPDKPIYDKFEAARNLVLSLLERAEGREHSPELLSDVELASRLLKELYDFTSKSETGSKARLNEAVIWAQIGYHERSVFLAGVAKERKIREPYRTQLAILPANACLARFRQIYRIERWIAENIEAAPNVEIAGLLSDLQRTYLQQMHYFATEAHVNAPTHAFATYMRILSCLLIAHKYETDDNQKASEQLCQAARSLANTMNDPRSNTHYMELQYHTMNYAEFTTFSRLSKKHSAITERLANLHAKAEQILKDGGGHRPKMYFNLSSYVAVGARAASIAGVVLLAGSAFGIDRDTVRSAVERIWHLAVATGQQFKGLGDIGHYVTNMSTDLAHTGGVATQFAHTGGLASPAAHTGGVATQLISSALANISLSPGGLASLWIA